jgi:CheY-like chemotaxis protein
MLTSSHVKIIPIGEVPLDDLMHSSEPKRPVVLVVHSDRMVADTLAVVLSRAGYATLAVYDGKTALELAFAVPPELLICDVEISGLNGIELAMAIVNTMPECKVLLFSSYETSADLSLARAAGYKFSSLTKPAHPEEILKQVMKCLKVPGVVV